MLSTACGTPARHCPLPHPLHLCPKSLRSPAAVRWCAKEVPAAQPHGLCAGCPAGHGAIGDFAEPLHTPRKGWSRSKVPPQLCWSCRRCQRCRATGSHHAAPGTPHPLPGPLGRTQRCCHPRWGQGWGWVLGWLQVGAQGSGAPSRAPAWLATREGLGRYRGCLALQGLMRVAPAFLRTLSQFFPEGSGSCSLLGWGRHL